MSEVSRIFEELMERRIDIEIYHYKNGETRVDIDWLDAKGTWPDVLIEAYRNYMQATGFPV